MGDAHAVQAKPQVRREPLPARKQPILMGSASGAEHPAGNQAMQTLLRGGAIHAKLSISQPGDADEHEADLLATSFAAGERIAGRCTSCGAIHPEKLQRKCAACEEEERLARSASNGAATRAVSVAQPQPMLGSSQGEHLPKHVRGEYEQFFSADLSNVRIHTDGAAQLAARAINAHAFTHRNDIYFAGNHYDPVGAAGRKLLAHELTHTLQQQPAAAAEDRVRRDAGPGAPTGVPAVRPGEPPAGPATPIGPPIPTKGYTELLYGVTISENKDQVKAAMRDEVVRNGASAPETFLVRIEAFGGSELEAAKKTRKEAQAPGGLSAGVPETEAELARREKVRDVLLPVVREAVAEVNRQARDFIDKFEKLLLENALATLTASRERTEAEQKRYGIQTTTDVRMRSLAGSVVVTTHHLSDENSPAIQGVKTAAGVLLARREKIEAQQAAVKEEQSNVDSVFETPAWESASNKLKEMQNSYNLLLQYIAREYPVLDRFGDLERDKEGLQQIANGKTELAVGTALGTQLADTLEKIEKSRVAVSGGKANLWRMKEVVDLSSAQIGLTGMPFEQRLMKDRFTAEQPHIIDAVIEGVLLLLLNVTAIALAAPTGGVSLAVAFGVNAALAAKHTMDYLQERALAGSDLLRAQALSHDDPSFFWLAVEILGVGLDAGPALAVFKKLVPLVKSARAAQAVAKEGKIAAETVEAINAVGREAGAAELGGKVIAKLGQTNEGSLVKLGIATEEEVSALGKVAATVEKDAATIGTGIKSAIGGEIKLSKSGHLFTCRSPCQWLRERYIEIFSRDSAAFDELLKLENRAQEVAKKARDAAKLEGKAGKAATQAAEEEAKAVEKAASELEARLFKKYPKLAGASEEEIVAMAIEEAEQELKFAAANSPDRLLIAEMPLPPPPLPKGVEATDPLWREYLVYYEARFKTTVPPGPTTGTAARPLRWESYQRFQGTVQGGTAYQKTVLSALEADVAQGKQAKYVSGMKSPEVLSNVGVKKGTETTKFADQLVVDTATLGSKKPRIEAFSNKSRDFPTKLDAAGRANVQSQVVEDASEALTKYGGKVELRRAEGTLGPLYGESVQVSKVTLVYDSSKASGAALRSLIRDAAQGVKVKGVSLKVDILFLP